MTSVMKTTLCRLLIVLMAWTPFQFAYAGIISTDQAVAATSAQADRAAVLNLISRSEIASQLQAMGLDTATAKDRVAALTDQEVRSLNDQLQSLPGGGSSGWANAAVILIGVLIWDFAIRK